MSIRNNWSLTPVSLFITHQKPKGLMTDEAVILGNKPENVEYQEIEEA